MPTAPPMGYYELPPAVYDNDAELAVWIDRSLAVAQRKASAKPRKKAR